MSSCLHVVMCPLLECIRAAKTPTWFESLLNSVQYFCINTKNQYSVFQMKACPKYGNNHFSPFPSFLVVQKCPLSTNEADDAEIEKKKWISCIRFGIRMTLHFPCRIFNNFLVYFFFAFLIAFAFFFFEKKKNKRKSV